jgi:hypothetical protein
MVDYKAWLKALNAIAKREQRERVARGLAAVKEAQRKGLQIRSVTIEDITLEFDPADTPAKATLTPLEAWKAKKHARSA